MPKSAILMFLSASRSKFSGFKSRWLRYQSRNGCYLPDHMTVTIVNSTDDLLEEDQSLLSVQPALFHQEIKELSALHILQHQKPASVSLQCTSLTGSGRFHRPRTASSRAGGPAPSSRQSHAPPSSASPHGKTGSPC